MLDVQTCRRADVQYSAAAAASALAPRKQNNGWMAHNGTSYPGDHGLEAALHILRGADVAKSAVTCTWRAQGRFSLDDKALQPHCPIVARLPREETEKNWDATAAPPTHPQAPRRPQTQHHLVAWSRALPTSSAILDSLKSPHHLQVPIAHPLPSPPGHRLAAPGRRFPCRRRRRFPVRGSSVLFLSCSATPSIHLPSRLASHRPTPLWRGSPVTLFRAGRPFLDSGCMAH